MTRKPNLPPDEKSEKERIRLGMTNPESWRRPPPPPPRKWPKNAKWALIVSERNAP